LYSSVNNHDTSKSILSVQELLGIIAVFSFLLYLLFPKGNIEDFLESQGNHTNLSINYLQSMILYHPDNVELKMILTEKYMQVGKEEKALDINGKLLEKTTNKQLLTKLYKIDYLLNKTLYFKNENPKELKNLKEKLLAYYHYTKGNRDKLFFFAEASNIDYAYLRYHSLTHFMQENPEEINYELEKMAFDLANQLNYKKEAYASLKKLIKYPKIDEELTEYLIYSLFEHRDFSKAKEITIKLFLASQTEDELTKFFHLALYALVQDDTKTKMEVSQLIQDYANLKELFSAEIVIILNTLLELGDSKEAANFAINMFYSNPENFDETGIDLALTSLLYNAELEEARAFSFFAESKFEKQKYLDQTIQISAWLGESEAVSALNQEGYYKYNSKTYEAYFLSSENLDLDYKVLGDIYKDKIKNGHDKYLKNMALYYDYTGEMNEAENYFTKISKNTKHKKASYYAIVFSHKNSHFKKGLALYEKYQLKHGINSELHELSIKKLLALKRFKKAYALSKELKEDSFLKQKQRFIDLAWLEKDYAHLHKKLWEFEKRGNLDIKEFDHFIILEQALNNHKKINYLYNVAWKKTKNAYYLNALMHKLLQEKKFNNFDNIIKNLTPNEKNILNNNIDFHILMANYHTEKANISLALKSYEKILQITPNKISSHQSYLWFLLDHKNKHPQLNKKIHIHLAYLQKHPLLQEKIGLSSIVAAMSHQKYKLAKYWLNKQLQKNPRNKEYKSLAKDIKNMEKEKLYAQHNKVLDNAYLNSEISLKRKNLGVKFRVAETAFTYQWKLYQNIKSSISVKHYAYKEAGKKNRKQTAFEIAFKNSKEKFLWDFSLSNIKAQKSLLSSSLKLDYDFHNIHVNIDSKYQRKTTLTPQLEKNALENALAVNLQVKLNRRSSFSFLAQKSKFKTLNGLNLGTAQQLSLSANYLLRSGYPDIRFNTYLNHNKFSKKIAKNFSELGIASSIGITRQKSLNTSWKPFGSFSLAINDEHNVGGSLTLGISKVLTTNDSLDLLFNYYNGIGVISEPIYGLNVKYRF
jgi:hypothetical protein